VLHTRHIDVEGPGRVALSFIGQQVGQVHDDVRIDLAEGLADTIELRDIGALEREVHSGARHIARDNTQTSFRECPASSPANETRPPITRAVIRSAIASLHRDRVTGRDAHPRAQTGFVSGANLESVDLPRLNFANVPTGYVSRYQVGFSRPWLAIPAPAWRLHNHLIALAQDLYAVIVAVLAPMTPERDTRTGAGKTTE
jgi:hypothetical protein